MDILIFFKNKIFLSIFWLENWYDVLKHPNTPFLRVWWGSWVQTGRKVAWTAKRTKSVFFCTVALPIKNASTLVIIIAKVRSLPTFLCRQFLSNVLGLSSMAVWIDATGFHSLREKRFVFTITSQMNATYLKRCGAVSRIQWCFHWLSSSTRSEGMAVQRRAVMGLVFWNCHLLQNKVGIKFQCVSATLGTLYQNNNANFTTYIAGTLCCENHKEWHKRFNMFVPLEDYLRKPRYPSGV